MKRNWFKLMFAAALLAAVACLAAGCSSTPDESEFVEKKLLYSAAYVTNDVVDGLPFLDFAEVELESRASFRGNGIFRADGTPVSMEFSYYYRNVYTGREFSYEFDDGGRLVLAKAWMSDGKDNETTVYNYDDNGRCTSYVRTNAEGAVTYRREHEYDAKGNMVRYLAYNLNDELCDKMEYEYDSKNNLTKETSYGYYEGEHFAHWIEYEYDKKGNRTHESSYNADGKRTYEVIQQYDKKGNLISKSRFTDSYGPFPYQKIEYEYDSNGVLRTEREYSDSSEHISIIEYDSDGDKIKEIVYRDDKLSSFTEYDQNGYEKRIMSYHRKDGGLNWCIEYDHDEYGNILEYTIINRDGAGYHAKYEYDHNGYRTKETVYDDGEINEVIHFDSFGRKIRRDIYKSGSVTGCEKYVYSDPVYTGDIDFPLTSTKLRTEYCTGAGVVLKYTEHDERVNRTYNSGGVLILLEEQGEYEFIDGKAVRYDTLTEYRPNGTLASVTVVDGDGEVVSVEKYDSEGKRIG